MKKKLIVLSVITGLCLIWIGVYSILPYFSGDVKQAIEEDEYVISKLVTELEFVYPEMSVMGGQNNAMSYQYKNYPFKLLSYSITNYLDGESVSVIASKHDLRELGFYVKENLGGAEYYYYFNEKKTSETDFKYIYDTYGVVLGSEYEQEIEFLAQDKRYILVYRECIGDKDKAADYNWRNGKGILLELMQEIVIEQQEKDSLE